ncbi:MAG TPA: hypothetical protein VFG68_23670 [Fimbriiglobus sp.]|nr:hypothetical protein [Fimbriiglobus sp.]
MFRRLLVGAVLAVGLAAPARAADVDALLPAETESVLFVNVRQVLESELVKKYALGPIKQALEGNDAKKMLEKLGLDPLKDVDRVTAGSWGKGKEDMNAVFIIRGKFDPVKLFKAAQEEAKKDGDKIAIVEDGKYKLVKFTVENSPKPIFAAVADEKTIVAATDKKLVTETLAEAEKGAKPQLKKELAELLKKQDEKASLFAVGLTEGKTGDVQIPPGLPGVDPAKLQKQLQNLKTFAMTVRLTKDVSLEVAMGMKDADAADDFGATVDGLLTTVKGFLPVVAGQNANAKPLIDEINKTLKSKVKEKDVTVSLSLSADAIGKATGGADD